MQLNCEVMFQKVIFGNDFENICWKGFGFFGIKACNIAFVVSFWISYLFENFVWNMFLENEFLGLGIIFLELIFGAVFEAPPTPTPLL